MEGIALREVREERWWWIDCLLGQRGRDQREYFSFVECSTPVISATRTVVGKRRRGVYMQLRVDPGAFLGNLPWRARDRAAGYWL